MGCTDDKMSDLALGVLLKDPVSRIADGDVALGSIFVQMHAAPIILAVEAGYMRVVVKDEKKYLELTEEGIDWYLASKKKPDITSPEPPPPEKIVFGNLQVGERFQLLVGVTPSKSIFNKLGDTEEDNAEIIGVEGPDKFCSVPANTPVLRVSSAS